MPESSGCLICGKNAIILNGLTVWIDLGGRMSSVLQTIPLSGQKKASLFGF